MTKEPEYMHKIPKNQEQLVDFLMELRHRVRELERRLQNGSNTKTN